MAAEPGDRPELRVVDENGALLGDMGDIVQRLQDELAGAEKDVRAWRMRFANLQRDVEAEARKDVLWPVAARVFEHWKKVCNHPRSSFDATRFQTLLPYVKVHGEALCKRAIDGAAFDPFVTERKNGSKKRHDGLDLIFRSAEKFEEFVCRAPRQSPPDSVNAAAADAPASPLKLV